MAEDVQLIHQAVDRHTAQADQFTRHPLAVLLTAEVDQIMQLQAVPLAAVIKVDLLMSVHHL